MVAAGTRSLVRGLVVTWGVVTPQERQREGASTRDSTPLLRPLWRVLEAVFNGSDSPSKRIPWSRDSEGTACRRRRMRRMMTVTIADKILIVP